MERTELVKGFTLSRIVHGHMWMAKWGYSVKELSSFLEKVIDLGITSFDHADIYGNYSCESLLGEVIHHNNNLRDRIEIITKCGIKLKSDKFPDRKIKTYDYSYQHIVTSVNNSLKNLNTGHIDLLLLHRPAPIFSPEEVAKAFTELKKAGKVVHFGVSNFSPLQYELISQYVDEKLVTNQVEISPYCLEHFDNGNMDFFLKEQIKPMAWSPVAGGKLFNPSDDKGFRIEQVLTEVAGELNESSVDTVVYSWLLKHPVNILPIAGTGNFERLQHAVHALELNLSMEQWYRIYNAARGCELP